MLPSTSMKHLPKSLMLPLSLLAAAKVLLDVNDTNSKLCSVDKALADFAAVWHTASPLLKFAAKITSVDGCCNEKHQHDCPELVCQD
jgi:hypothetical protein